MPTNVDKARFCIDAVLLAAGSSQRFNSAKQLAMIDNQTMLVRSIDMLQKSNVVSTTVVLGANAPRVQECIAEYLGGLSEGATVRTIFAADWQKGMGASLAHGVQNLADNVTHVFVGLADQVEIRSKQCNLMIATSKQHPTKIISALYKGNLGAPAIFPRAYFERLTQLSNDKGARDILRTNAIDTIAIDLPEAAQDIDTENDLRAYLLSKK